MLSTRRRVSFNKQVQAVYIRHHKDYSKKELERCWHSHEDYAAMNDEANHTIDYYHGPQSDIVSDDSSSSSHDDCLADSNFYLRGLEHRTSEKGIRCHLRRAAWNAVLEEQEVQHDLGMSNHDDILRDVYITYSLPASRIAQQKGWKDAIEAGHAMKATTAFRRTLAQKNSMVSQAA